MATPASVSAVINGTNPPFTGAEAVTLTGGAGADWTPTKNAQTRALWIGGSGALKIDFADGSAGITLQGVPVGRLDVSVTKVYNTTDGTVATNIVALY